ncbi:MAG: PilC/PilY family type IV pilus protein, partial [Gammaproteobacteria bacterium]|nr:PilC/PilY family type IV pilus protein [Gammaproteobacteria bacterium]
NDGYMRYLRNTTVGGQQSGEEVWGFMPQSVMDKVKTLRTNAPGIKHPYMVDGAPVVWMDDANSNGTIDAGEDAWLFFGLRRGGRAYYALDVSDPESPDLLWKIEKNGDFAELGNTFSNPRVIRVDTGSGEQPAIVFGGGYDFNKDDRTGVGTDDSEGNAIYIVDAETGQLIWKAVGSGAADTDTFVHPDLVDSIPSTVSILDSDGNGLHDRLYVGDTGGNVWRADMPGANVANWKLTKLASIGRHSAGAAGKEDDRRFFHRPDIVQSADKDGPFDAVVIASGDRPDPLDKGGLATNWMYMIKDRNFKVGTGVDTALNHFSFGDVTNTCLEFGGECTADLTSGWALQLAAQGEKGLSTPLTINNVVFFTSYLPPNGSPEGACSPAEGSGRLYAVSLKDASATTNYDTTDEDLDRFTELDSKGIPAEVVSLPPKSILRPDLKVDQTNAPTRFQTYWFEEEDGDL